MIRFILGWGLSGIFNLPLWRLYLDPVYQTDSQDLIWALVWALVGIIPFFFSFPKGPGWFHPLRLWVRPFSLLYLFLPGLGWLLSGVLFWVGNKYKPVNQQEEVEPTPNLLDLVTRLSAKPRTREDLANDLDVIPLTDILRGDDVDLKRDAVEKLALVRSPESIALLLEHRSDPSAEVRFFATSALTRLKREYQESVAAAKEEMQRDIRNPEARLGLARVYLDYADSGLLDSDTAANLRKEARYNLHFAMELGSKNPEVNWSLYRICEASQDWDEALALLDQLESLDPVHQPAVFRARAELHFERRDWASLKKDMAALGPDPETGWKVVQDWWGVSRSSEGVV